MTLPQFVDQELVLHDLRVEQVLPLPHREVREFRRERPRDLAALDEVDDLLARQEGLRLPIRQAHPTIAAEQAGDPPEPRIPDEIPHQLELYRRGKSRLLSRSRGPRGDEFYGAFEVAPDIAQDLSETFGGCLLHGGFVRKRPGLGGLTARRLRFRCGFFQ